MATLTKDAPAVNLTIKGQPYAATTYTPEADGYRNGVCLEKRDGTTYDVVDGPHGAECDCPDFEARHRGLPTAGCKHVQACRAAGLIASPDPTARKPLPAAGRPSTLTRAQAEYFGLKMPAPTPAPAPVKFSFGLAAKVANAIAKGEAPDPEEARVVREHFNRPLSDGSPAPGTAPVVADVEPDPAELVASARRWVEVASRHWDDEDPSESEPEATYKERMRAEDELQALLNRSGRYGVVVDGLVILSNRTMAFDVTRFAAAYLEDVAGIEAPTPEPAPAEACCDPAEVQPCTACAGSPAEAPAPAPDNLTRGEGDGRRDELGEDLGSADPIDDLDDADGFLEDFDPELDSFTWELGPDPDAEPARLTLDAWIDAEADRFRALGHGGGRLIADHLATLARSIRFVHAATPDAYLARTDALDAGRWEDQGEPDA